MRAKRPGANENMGKTTYGATGRNDPDSGGADANGLQGLCCRQVS